MVSRALLDEMEISLPRLIRPSSSTSMFARALHLLCLPFGLLLSLPANPQSARSSASLCTRGLMPGKQRGNVVSCRPSLRPGELSWCTQPSSGMEEGPGVTWKISFKLLCKVGCVPYAANSSSGGVWASLSPTLPGDRMGHLTCVPMQPWAFQPMAIYSSILW